MRSLRSGGTRTPTSAAGPTVHPKPEATVWPRLPGGTHQGSPGDFSSHEPVRGEGAPEIRAQMSLPPPHAKHRNHLIAQTPQVTCKGRKQCTQGTERTTE